MKGLFSQHPSPNPWKRFKRGWPGFLCFVATSIILAGHVNGQEVAPSASPAEKLTPPAIALEEIPSEIESATTRIRDIKSDLSADRTAETVSEQLPALTREVGGQVRESRRVVAQTRSIETLRSFEKDWSRLRRELSGLNRILTDRVKEIDGHIAQLDDLGKTWDQTFNAAKESSAPAEVVGRIETVISEVRQTREAAEKQRALTLTILNRVGVQDARIADALRSLSQARQKTLNRLFLRDGMPLWSSAVELGRVQDLQSQSLSSFSTQIVELSAYLERQAIRFVLAAGVFVAVVAGLLSLRRRTYGRVATEVDFSPPIAVFESPIAASLILSLLASRWIFPEAPRLLYVALDALLLVPSLIILRRIVTAQLRGILYALIACFLLDQLRAMAAVVEPIPRLLFVAEMLGTAGFLLWFMRTIDHPERSGWSAARSGKVAKLIARIALAISTAAFLANIFGYLSLADLLGTTLLQSSYLAMILFAVIEVLDGLATIALSLRPLAALAAVSRYRSLLRLRTRRTMQLLAALFWLASTLQWLLLRDPLFGAARAFLTAEFSIGSIHVSPGNVLAFGITVWLSFVVSRFIRFLLEEDVYQRAHLNRGLPYAISTTLHYVIAVVGFFLAVGALGFDMTRFTILAGAFSVGVGFGLQNIFNNFISGLILLFERPINIGDVIRIDDASGVVERIGIRASVIRTNNGSKVIVPNGKLISERLTNSTLSSRRYGIELPIAVAHGTDAKRAITLLQRTAAAHPLIARDPPPKAVVVKLGVDALNFELRAWTDRTEQWMDVRSELAITISSALAANGIVVQSGFEQS
jgi:potassium efflux system protein